MEILGVKSEELEGLTYCRSEKPLKIGTVVCLKRGGGVRYGKVVSKKCILPDKKAMLLPYILRVANKTDMVVLEKRQRLAEKVFKRCSELAYKNGLRMHLINAFYDSSRNRVIVFFKSSERVDFRDLVHSLADFFRVRVELRQVGARDQAKRIGGMGVCGRVVCCQEFLRDFEPISVKKVRSQMPFLNMNKISGLCGRLMCCFKFETNLTKQESAISQERPTEGTEVVARSARPERTRREANREGKLEQPQSENKNQKQVPARAEKKAPDGQNGKAVKVESSKGRREFFKPRKKEIRQEEKQKPAVEKAQEKKISKNAKRAAKRRGARREKTGKGGVTSG